MTADPQSVYELFAERAHRYPNTTFLAIPRRLVATWDWPREITYGEALAAVDRTAAHYEARGYGQGDIIALVLDSRPQQLVHYLALNGIGACSVPINPELSATEMSHLFDHSQSSAVITIAELAPRVTSALAMGPDHIPVASPDLDDLPVAESGRSTLPQPSSVRRRPTAILYTSGTTGRPKGCIIDNAYALKSGRAYGSPEPDLTLRGGVDRVMNPLPMFHMNTLMLTAGGVIDRAACLVLPGRFSLRHWWSDIRDTAATRFHYLGLMIPALLATPPHRTPIPTTEWSLHSVPESIRSHAPDSNDDSQSLSSKSGG